MTLAEKMRDARAEFLARACFAGQQNRRIVGAEQGYALDHFEKCRVPPDKLLEPDLRQQCRLHCGKLL
jgi:hypothetical protein